MIWGGPTIANQVNYASWCFRLLFWNTTMRIVVTGAHGQLGKELCWQLGPMAIPLDIDTLELTDRRAVQQQMLALRPAAIINCAAYTQIDRAEDDVATCRAVNATAVGYLADVCNKLDCPLVQVSTDHVFSGEAEQPVPLREDATPCPEGVYATTKLEGEWAAAQHAKHLIVRTCGLYARPSDSPAVNFVKTMLWLGKSRDELRIVADQHCTPSYVPDIARAILFLIGGAHDGGHAPWGIYHVTNRGETTWYDFAVEIFRLADIAIRVQPITTAQYGTGAPRPSYSVLDISSYCAMNGPPMPDWKASLTEYLAARAAQSAFR